MVKKRVRPGHSRNLPEGRRLKREGRLIGDVKETNYGRIRQSKEIRKNKKKAVKLRKEVKRREWKWKPVTTKRPKAHLKTLTARIKKETGKKKKPGTKAVRPVINVLVEEAGLTKQWAAVAKSLVREGLIKVDENTDLKKKMYETLLEIDPRAASFFKAGLNIYTPRGKMPIIMRLKLLSTKERMLVRDARGRTVRAVKRPSGRKKEEK